MNLDAILTRPAATWSVDNLATLLDAPADAEAELAAAADALTTRRHGDVVTYVVNRNLNFSNQCTIRCHFCAYWRTPKHPEAFRLTPAEAVARVSETPWVTEVCIQGAIDLELPFRFYKGLLRAIKQWKPSVHLHAFSPQEIYSLAQREKEPVEKILGQLRDAGLDSMPGTAAEILVDSVRLINSPRRLSVGQWTHVIETAHRMGIRTSATMMFGHVERTMDRAHHFVKLRRIQEKTRGFTEFVPMPFMSQNTALRRAGYVDGSPVASTTLERILAVSRLYFDDIIPNIQVSWVKAGPAQAARALRTGANDLGGTLYEENITRLAGGQYGVLMTPEDFHAIAQMAGRRAVERRTLYELVA